MELIEKLNLLMKKNNIKNLSQLSKETNIPYTTLKSIFDGDVNDIRLSTSRKLCDYFKITLDDLLDDSISLYDVRMASYNAVDTDGLNETDIEEVNRFIETFIRPRKSKNK